MPRREGALTTGLGTIVAKEMADHLGGARMRLLEGLILLTTLASVYAATRALADVAGAGASEDPFLALRLFTIAQDPLPSFVAFLGFLLPLAAITLAFDTVNREHAQGTFSRILAQPIFRDAVLLGKFLAGLATLAITLLALWLAVIGLGLLLTGVPPSLEEVARLLAFWALSVVYAGVWLALALLFSVLFRQPATSALAALAVWLLFAVFWSIVAGLGAQLAAPATGDPIAGAADRAAIERALLRISPDTLYQEAIAALLYPETRSLGPVTLRQLQGALPGAPLPFSQSVALIWPHVAGLAATVLLLFAAGYVAFQRQEVRA